MPNKFNEDQKKEVQSLLGTLVFFAGGRIVVPKDTGGMKIIIRVSQTDKEVIYEAEELVNGPEEYIQ